MDQEKTFWQKLAGFMLSRLSERSTWVGTIGLVSAAGVSLSPDQATGLATAGVAVASVVSVFTKG